MSTRNRFPNPHTPEERAEYVASLFQRQSRELEQHDRELLTSCVKQLRRDFKALKPGETIHGCKSWLEFCRAVLHLTERAIGYRMAGGNPRSKRRNSSQSNDNAEKHCGGLSPFEQDEKTPTPFATIPFNLVTEKDFVWFADLIYKETGQKITPKTPSVWIPALDKVRSAHKKWVYPKPELTDEAA